MKLFLSKYSILILLFTLTSLWTFAQTITWNRKAGPTGGNVKDVEYDPATGKVFALIESKIFVSTDNGINWTSLIFSGSSNYFYDIEITNGVIYLINGYDIYTSTDGGLTFSKKNTDSVLSAAYRLKRLSSGTLVALASNRVYTSSTNGVSWVAGASGSFNSNYLIVNNLDQIFTISSSTGLPIRSIDGGTTFTTVPNANISAGGTVFSLAANNSGSLIYCVNAAGLWSSTDGANWTSIKGGSISDAAVASSTQSASFLEFSGDGLGMYFIDNLNKKLHYKGVSELASAWLLSTAFPGTSLSVTCSTAKNYVTPSTSTAIFGTIAGLFRTTTGGGTIFDANSGITGVRPSELVSIDNGDLIMNATSLGLLLSSNGGDSWTRVTSVPTSVTKLSTNSTQNNIFAVTNSPVYDLYRSQDKGINWTNLATPTDFRWVSGSDNDRVFAFSNSNTFYYSNNNGTNWTATSISITGLPASYSIYDNTISLASSSRMLFQLYNFGTSAFEYWRIDFTIGAGLTITGAATKIQTTLPFGVNLNKIAAANGRFYAYTSNPNPNQVATSSDGGATWTITSAPTSSGQMFVASNGYIFVSSYSDNKLFISRDNGGSFVVETNLPSTVTPYNIQDIEIDPSGYAYLAVDAEFIHKSNITVVTPAAPSGLALAGKSATAVALKWNDNSTVEDYYQIEISTDAINYANIGQFNRYDICSSPSPTGYFVAQGLTANTAYTFRVKAVNDAGASSGIILGVTTLNASTPNIPDNRSWDAINSGETGNAVVATKIVGVKHLGGGRYEVSDVTLGAGGISSRKDTFFESSGQTLLITTNGSDQIKPNSNGTWNGTNALTLKWRECYSNDDAINDTETITLTLRASDLAPAAPTGVSALVASNTTIEVSWLQGYYEKEYVIERSLSSGTGFSSIATVQYPATNYIDNGPFVNGTAYYYRIKARNANVVPLESPYSAVTSAVFNKPNFVVSSTTVSNFIATTVGSYWADFNNDGLEDLFSLSYDFTTEFGSPVIFKDLGTGNFLQVPVSFGAEKYIFGFTADLNNDGFSDIALSIQDKARYDIYKNNGDFTFTKFSDLEKGDIALISNKISGSSSVDFSNDGRLDILLLSSSNTSNKPELFKQNVGGSFTKVTGGDLALDIQGYNSASWADYDNDGDQDVVFAGGTCSLYKNNGNETFTLTTGIGFDATNAFSFTWGDYNNDGYLDLYAAMSAQTALYKNNGNGTFTKDISTSISEAFFGVSASWGDINNDGLLDIITPMFISGTGSRIFLNTSTASTTNFTKITTEKLCDLKNSHYGLGLHDYDKDGFLDVFMSAFQISSGDPSPVNAYLYKNNNSTGNWIQIKLAGTSSNKRGIGTRVTVTAGGKIYTREVAITSLISQNSPIVHVGLGSASSITTVQVKWPSGIVQNLSNVSSNQLLVVTEDNIGPVASALSPANGAATVNANTTLSITLNETSTAASAKTIKLFKTSDLVNPVASIDVSTAVVSGNIFTFSLSQKLLPNTSYSVAVDAGAFQDVYGNPSLAMGASSWQFTSATGPLANLLNPVDQASNVAVDTKIEITFNIPPVAVAGKKITITPAIGTAIVLDASAGVIVGNKVTFTLSSALAPLQQSVTVEAGAFTDINGNATAAINWSFVTIDNIAPTITFSAPAQLDYKFNSTPFVVTATDNTGQVSSATLSYRKIAGGTFTDLPGTFDVASSKWNFTVLESFFDATGLEFFLTAKDATNNIGRLPLDANTNFYTYLNYKAADNVILSDRIGFGGTVNGWKIFTIPFELGSNSSISTVLDELSALVVKTDWRMLTYKDNTAWGEYPTDFSSFTRGKGYFINIKNSITLKMPDALTPSNNRKNLFQMALKKGWNQVGNPYLTPISWDDVKNFTGNSGLTGTGAVLKTFTGGSYANATTLQPFEGGFVLAENDVTVSIPFSGQLAIGGKKETPAFGEGDWVMPLTLKNGDFENNFGGVGMHSQASHSYDQFDDVNAPRFINYLEMNFAHPEHLAKQFARDVVPAQEEFVWSFKIESNQSGLAAIDWDSKALGRSSKEIYLFDVELQKPINMREASSYQFDPKISGSFKIFYGDNLDSKIKPSRIQLGQAFPNPSSGEVTIPFTLHDQSGAYHVQIEVFDTKGRKVATLADGEYVPGFYSLTWNSQQNELRSGLYLYRMRVNGTDVSEVQTKKVIIDK
jgi:ASPIC and UnbV/Bacterial Ig-like domain/FG-GAP-like repeat